ncbi:MAG: DNA alkylation repair protein [Ignavibacteriales bacterium]|nr:DNA alkylation repair protein [Ignavibacteriales bacterium]
MLINIILEKLHSFKNTKNIEGMARFGMSSENRLGISIYTLREIAKEIPKSNKLAKELWKTGIAEARILASMVDKPEKVTNAQMEKWVKDFNSWDVCDQVCDNLFQWTKFVYQKIDEWAKRKEEFVMRAAFTLVACVAFHHKELSDEYFINLFPIIQNASTDERNFVKKAVNWAIRNIGKRNLKLNKEAIKFCKEFKKIDSKSARWIANDALRELQSEKIHIRLQKKK